jgi:hypothetical protein
MVFGIVFWGCLLLVLSAAFLACRLRFFCFLGLCFAAAVWLLGCWCCSVFALLVLALFKWCFGGFVLFFGWLVFFVTLLSFVCMLFPSLGMSYALV